MGVGSRRYTADMHQEHPIVSRDEWLRQRAALLHEEKALTQQRDRLSERRRALPWVRIEPGYVFDTTTGPKDLAALFGPHSQLAVYHFMLAPDWEAGCKSCSFWADNFEGIAAHLAHRDTALVAISRAPLAKLRAYAARMGWSFEWVSSAGSTFNVDFGVSFTPEQLAAGEVDYNYGKRRTSSSELPGISVFARRGEEVFHTYSTYGRGIEVVNGAYAWLDMVPKGRDEADGPMAWLRRRDEYEG